MNPVKNLLEGKKIMILGLGREGLSTYRFIRKYLPEIPLKLSDNKDMQSLKHEFSEILHNDNNTTFISGEDYLSDLASYNLIIKTPGIPNKLKEIKKAKQVGVKFTSQSQIFLENFRDKVIGITGTKGKSTTASLIYHILKESGKKVELLGNIGKPVLDYFDAAHSVDHIVFEMSSHQLSDIKISPHIALFLNIFPEHLDYYEDFGDYFNAKANIAKYQNSTDMFVYNSDFDMLNKLASISPARHLALNSVQLPALNIGLVGAHNLLNVKAAYLAATNCGLDDRQIYSAVKSFTPLEGRLEKVGSVNGTDFVNDTLATIPEATIAALESFSGRKTTLILGGFDRGVEFDALGKAISQKDTVVNTILIGQTGSLIKAALLKYKFKNKIYELGTASMKKIVNLAAKITPQEGVVLLSPASTSFDMFRDYKDRGDQFRNAVLELSK